MRTVIKYVTEHKLGMVALGLCLVFMFIGLPSQIYTIWVTRSVHDISLPMFLLLMIQSFGWVAYGIQQKDWIMVTANACGAVFTGIIVMEYFMFK